VSERDGSKYQHQVHSRLLMKRRRKFGGHFSFQRCFFAALLWFSIFVALTIRSAGLRHVADGGGCSNRAA
jgi:hypothetical protein